MRHTLIAILAVVLMASSAMAQIEKGDREFQATGYLFAASGLTTIRLGGIYGYSLTDKLQLGGGPTLTIEDYDFGSNTTLGLTFFGRHYFNARNKLVPYASAQWYQYDIAPDGGEFFDFTFLQGGFGFKYFMNEHLAWDVSCNLGFSLGGEGVCFFTVAGLSWIL